MMNRTIPDGPRSAAASVTDNVELCRGHFGLTVELPSPWRVRPGQFLMVRVSDGPDPLSLDPLLRRPFGVADVAGGALGGGLVTGTRIEIIYRVVGRGTAIMSRLRPGDVIDVLGPLGNGFPPVEPGRRLVMVAGGIGIPPFKLLARTTGGTLLFGARTGREAALAEQLRAIGGCTVRTATEDGSVGHKGLVTDLLAEEVSAESVVYACGPAAMLRAVARLCAGRGVECHVSLESSMACGMGVCLGCAVRAAQKDHAGAFRPLMVCCDGPVFESSLIDWEAL
ncbi:MAG TPA: dihydroorotate dehydrogenase electron transfer subunit [Deltaproteobacteria bacterium]|nr:dihydroorotate dehydrogenase electron transfer subunit [Deltaproteobacteria bacterium]